jgi:hypothetical protein
MNTKPLLEAFKRMDEAMDEAMGKRKCGLDQDAAGWLSSDGHGPMIGEPLEEREPTMLTAIDQATSALQFAQDNWMKQARLAQLYLEKL